MLTESTDDYFTNDISFQILICSSNENRSDSQIGNPLKTSVSLKVNYHEEIYERRCQCGFVYENAVKNGISLVNYFSINNGILVDSQRIYSQRDCSKSNIVDCTIKCYDLYINGSKNNEIEKVETYVTSKYTCFYHSEYLIVPLISPDSGFIPGQINKSCQCSVTENLSKASKNFSETFPISSATGCDIDESNKCFSHCSEFLSKKTNSYIIDDEIKRIGNNFLDTKFTFGYKYKCIDENGEKNVDKTFYYPSSSYNNFINKFSFAQMILIIIFSTKSFSKFY